MIKNVKEQHSKSLWDWRWNVENPTLEYNC